MSETPPSGPLVHQLRVVLRGISPLIWRRILVRSDGTIANLHATLQLALGRSDEHLHRFVVHGREYGISCAGGLSFRDHAAEVRLADLGLRAGERFLYEYDFPDSWGHDMRMEQILPVEPKRQNRSAPAAEPSLRRTAEGPGRSWSFGRTTHPSASPSGWSRPSNRWATAPTTSMPSAKTSRSSGPGSGSIASTAGRRTSYSLSSPGKEPGMRIEVQVVIERDDEEDASVHEVADLARGAQGRDTRTPARGGQGSFGPGPGRDGRRAGPSLPGPTRRLP
jgi:pRiA4b ORF-3-like protein